MNRIKFCKLHGFGNDYIVFEADDLKNISLNQFAQNVCHRNTGIGGDGIAVLEKSENKSADYACRIINPDGSEAGFSGNGTRCAVAYLYYKNLWSNESLRLETKSGIKTYELLDDKYGYGRAAERREINHWWNRNCERMEKFSGEQELTTNKCAFFN
jgi:diaminopimelate epimerase